MDPIDGERGWHRYRSADVGGGLRASSARSCDIDLADPGPVTLVEVAMEGYTSRLALCPAHLEQFRSETDL